MTNQTNPELPLDGWAGLKQNFSSDLTAGFSVFLLALPLSLGIAKASDFPPLMGLVTAILGGMLVSFFSGSRLTIKGPAAGLIVIVLGAVKDFGGGDLGWHLALGAMFGAGILQIFFGAFRLGRLVDFFPLSAVHGMLAAIGIIILLKQFPVLLDVDPKLTAGKSPFELIAAIPMLLQNLDPKATLVGVISLWIMMDWNRVSPTFLRKIPAPLVVLLVAIPAQLLLKFDSTEPKYALMSVGNFIASLKINVDFGGWAQPLLFGKYVLMLALVGSLESLLTVKAIDLADPFHRKSDTNKDLMAIGIGNTIAAVLGGLPMISEVARSSANVANGARTRWANFYHGALLFLFIVLAARVLNLIPNTALAAMLITVGLKLAHPRQFLHIFQIGKDQLAVFLTTIIFTLYTDLLIGIAAGILLKICMHLWHGAPIRSLFSVQAGVSFTDRDYLLEVEKVAIFTNFLGIKSRLEAIPTGMDVTIDFSRCTLVDSSVMEAIHHFQKQYTQAGGTVQILGLDRLTPSSDHQFSTRIKTQATPQP
jgi:MFS superfamily sulfate permease-like transporter